MEPSFRADLDNCRNDEIGDCPGLERTNQRLRLNR